MKYKVITAILLTLLLTGMLTLAFDVQPVKAAWIGYQIRIYADGSFYPSDAPISVDGNIYTLTDDILSHHPTPSDAIITVYCSNIVLDGDGHTIQPYPSSSHCNGIFSYADNVIIRNMVIEVRYTAIFVSGSGSIISGNTITGSMNGVWLFSSNTIVYGNTILDSRQMGIGISYNDYNTISGNTIAGTKYRGAIYLGESSHNTISENNIELSDIAVVVREAYDNTFFHNNFVDNTLPIYDISWDHPEWLPSINDWDNGYPSGGNYWSDYEGVDANGDGIGDTPYFIYDDNQDNYPLMEPWTSQESIGELTEIIETMSLPKGTERSLTSKLGDALKLLDKGNENGAIHKLMDFICQVEALREDKLTNEQADYLILKAQIIISQIKE